MKPVDTEITEIRAILDLKAKGWEEADILRALKISRATLYRRLAKAERRRAKGLHLARTPA